MLLVVRSVLFCDIMQRRVVIRYDVWGQPIGPIFKCHSIQEECLDLEDGTDSFSRNVGNELPLYAA